MVYNLVYSGVKKHDRAKEKSDENRSITDDDAEMECRRQGFRFVEVGGCFRDEGGLLEIRMHRVKRRKRIRDEGELKLDSEELRVKRESAASGSEPSNGGEVEAFRFVATACLVYLCVLD